MSRIDSRHAHARRPSAGRESYRPRRPETTAPCQVVARHLPAFLGQLDEDGSVGRNELVGPGAGVSGGGVLGTSVKVIQVFDDGSSPALYAGGSFAVAGGVPMHAISKWDGLAWLALDAGVSGGALPSVNALAVFDDGTGAALFAGGNFSSSPAGDSSIAKWGGCSAPPSPWTDLGSGLAGVSGIPQLTGVGDLLAGTPGSLGLADAAHSALADLFVSTSSTPTPLKGGMLLTVPVLLTLPPRGRLAGRRPPSVERLAIRAFRSQPVLPVRDPG